ncbi:MAG TPA: MarR family transcriptional regulator [Stellaceae bacterium]|nr:MarR family transcriptional regulator [Stellaceae bacterium]
MSSTPQGSLLFLREEELRQGLDLLFFAARDLGEEADAAVTAMGLGTGHRQILHFVGREPQISVGGLLDILHLTKQTLSRLVHELIERGLVAQLPGAIDRRQRLLSLTDEGRKLERLLWERQRQRIARAWRGAGPDAVEGFRRVLLGLVEAPRDRRRFERGTGG